MPDTDRHTSSIYGSMRRVICLSTVVIAALLGAGCQSNGSIQDTQSSAQVKKTSKDAFTLGLENSPSWMNDVDTTQDTDIWRRIRKGFKLQSIMMNNPRVDQHRLWFASRGRSIEIMSERSSPYMYYIVESLEARNMPLELALLPMIESAYDPHAYSRSHASGLWQFIPSTGRHFKLKQSQWYDARRDIMASTQAALDYLQYLNNMFDGDWLLALAAYNAGEGTVGRAIKRNKELGLPTDYWNLNLPTETQGYVPKLLAVSQLINSPEAYGIALSPIANEAYFTQIPLKQQTDISRLARMAKVNESDLLKLNPAYKQNITFDGPRHLLVPKHNAELLSAKLAMMKPSNIVQWQKYTVRGGDNLLQIANRHGVSTSLIKDTNNLTSDILSIGQVLSIPKSSGSTVNNLAQVKHSSPASTIYTVRAGDNLSKVAAQYKVSVADIKRWNKLSSNTVKIGQKLTLAGNAVTVASKPAAQSSRASFYKVRPGDSFYAIAKRHKVTLQQLQNWNPKVKALKAGQTLALYL